jgi:hypothetical protein
MKLEKWKEFKYKIESEAHQQLCEDVYYAPEKWPEIKKVYLNFVKQMDELTNIYNLENKEK